MTDKEFWARMCIALAGSANGQNINSYVKWADTALNKYRTRFPEPAPPAPVSEWEMLYGKAPVPPPPVIHMEHNDTDTLCGVSGITSKKHVEVTCMKCIALIAPSGL